MDFMQLSLAELEELETHTGVPLGQLMTKLAAGDYSAKMLQGLTFILNRRVDEQFSLDDAKDASFSEALAVLSGNDDDDDADLGKE